MVGPWRDDPDASLREIQAIHLRSVSFDYSASLAAHLASREAVRLSEADDPYNLLDYYRAEVDRLENWPFFRRQQPRTTRLPDCGYSMPAAARASGASLMLLTSPTPVEYM